MQPWHAAKARSCVSGRFARFLKPFSHPTIVQHVNCIAPCVVPLVSWPPSGCVAVTPTSAYRLNTPSWQLAFVSLHGNSSGQVPAAGLCRLFGMAYLLRRCHSAVDREAGLPRLWRPGGAAAAGVHDQHDERNWGTRDECLSQAL